MRFKKIVSVVISVVMLVVPFLSSCSVKQVNDSLKVYFYPNGMDQELIDKAIFLFEKQSGIKVTAYNEVPPNYKEGRDEYFNKLSAEIMAGNAPDVFVTSVEFLTNIFKMMESGAFLDFDTLIKKDSEFNLSDYEKMVMDTGIYSDARFLMPISYHVPLLFTTGNRLGRYGLQREDFENYESLLDTALTLQNEGVSYFVPPFSYGFMWSSGGWFQEMVNIEEKTVDISAPTIDKAIKFLKNEELLRTEYDVMQTGFHSSLIDYEKGIFCICPYVANEMIYLASAEGDDDVEMFTIPNINGQSTATVASYCMISSTSVNVKNAWEFVKILLGDECQSNMSIIGDGVGVATQWIDANIEAQMKRQESRGYGSVSNKHENMVKELYKTCDNAIIASAHSGVLAYLEMEILQGYILNSDYEKVDLNAVKEQAKNNLSIWLNE